MRRFIYKKFVFFVLFSFVLQLVCCTNGGIKSTLENQNNSAEEFFAKLGELVQATFELEERMAAVSSDDTESQDEIVFTVSHELVPLTAEVYAAGDEIFEAESDLQALTSSSQHENFRHLTEIRPQAALPVIFGVCVLVLSADAMWESLSDNHKTYMEKWEQCIQQREMEKAAIPRELPLPEQHELLEEAWWNYEDCVATAGNKTTWEDTKTSVAYILGDLSPAHFASRWGRIAIKSFDAALDYSTVFVYGTNPEPENKRREGLDLKKPDTFFAATEDDSEGPNIFFAKTDGNGEIIAPVGQWHMVAFTPGYVRFGTPPGQTVQVFEDQTTEVEASSVPASEATAEDFASCDTGDNVTTTTIDEDNTYEMDLSEGNVEDFKGTWFLKKESALGGSLIARFYSDDESKFQGFVNETYDEIHNDWYMTGAAIVCVHAEKISDTP